MASVKVPASQRNPIRFLARVDDAQFERLTSGLSEPTNGELRRSGVASVVEQALDCTSEQAEDLVRALLGATASKDGDLDAARVAASVAADPNLGLDEAEAAKLRDRLSVLLDEEPLDLIARGVSLFYEDEHVFCRGRIVSDLRPIFDRDNAASVDGLFIHHSLKIRYHLDSGSGAFYVTLDQRGLLQLRDSIDRALAKADSLSDLARARGVQIVEIEEVH